MIVLAHAVSRALPITYEWQPETASYFNVRTALFDPQANGDTWVLVRHQGTRPC